MWVLVREKQHSMVSDAKSLPREAEVAMKTYDSVVGLCLSGSAAQAARLGRRRRVDQKVWGRDLSPFWQMRSSGAGARRRR